MVSNIQLACILRTYRTCYSTVEISKYELLKITLDITQTQPKCVCVVFFYFFKKSKTTHLFIHFDTTQTRSKFLFTMY